ncbi:MAG TPA: acetyl-CoA C-acetyltransferase [Candidatus Methylomirabilis sp.]|nr:acetyl-CoA C-acetyltransferase [Candidatus Methylomirabilis sp.]
MRDVVIVGAVRTAIGTFGGSLKEFSATDLGVIVVGEALKRAGLKPGSVDEVIMGNVLQAGLGENPARQCAVRAGIPVEVPSYTINKLCGSGLKAVALGALAISSGESEVVVAGGTESMTNAPYLLTKGRWGFRMGDETVVDSMLNDGLLDAFSHVHMGITAENLAERFKIGREEQDAFANESIRRALAAIEQQAFREEIVPIEIPQKRGSPFIFDVDEFPRTRPAPEAMAGLRPAFKKDGTVTGGTASGISDGAAAVVLMAREKAEAEDVAPLARIRAYATAGVDPQIMGTGPIAAVKKVLEKTGLSIDEIDLVESNEAFAVQALCVAKALKFKAERTNISGGAVALGHPIGASGCRLLVTLLYGMKRLDKHVGLATLCIGGGQGIAMVVER